LIEARGLTKDYGDKRAVDGLTFTVEPGIVTGFLGRNRRSAPDLRRLLRLADAQHRDRRLGALSVGRAHVRRRER